jgi:hypothetical protein
MNNKCLEEKWGGELWLFCMRAKLMIVASEGVEEKEKKNG